MPRSVPFMYLFDIFVLELLTGFRFREIREVINYTVLVREETLEIFFIKFFFFFIKRTMVEENSNLPYPYDDEKYIEIKGTGVW